MIQPSIYSNQHQPALEILIRNNDNDHNEGQLVPPVASSTCTSIIDFEAMFSLSINTDKV